MWHLSDSPSVPLKKLHALMEVKFKCTYMYVCGGTKCKCVLHHVFMEIQCKFTNLQTSAHCGFVPTKGMVQIGKRDAPVVPSNWVTESNIVEPPWYFHSVQALVWLRVNCVHLPPEHMCEGTGSMPSKAPTPSQDILSLQGNGTGAIAKPTCPVSEMV